MLRARTNILVLHLSTLADPYEFYLYSIGYDRKVCMCKSTKIVFKCFSLRKRLYKIDVLQGSNSTRLVLFVLQVEKIWSNLDMGIPVETSTFQYKCYSKLIKMKTIVLAKLGTISSERITDHNWLSRRLCPILSFLKCLSSFFALLMVQSSSPDSPADYGLTDLFACACIDSAPARSAGTVSERLSSAAPVTTSDGESPVLSFVKNLDAVAYGGVSLASDKDDKKLKFPDPFEDRKLPTTNFPSPFKTSSDLVFVFDPEHVCGSNVGQTGEKWCAVPRTICQDTGPKSHQVSSKFENLQPGLFIWVHSVDPDKVVAYTEPFIPLEKLTPKMVESFLSFNGERTPTERRKEFSYVLDSDPDDAEEERLKKESAIRIM